MFPGFPVAPNTMSQKQVGPEGSSDVGSSDNRHLLAGQDDSAEGESCSRRSFSPTFQQHFKTSSHVGFSPGRSLVLCTSEWTVLNCLLPS